MPVLNAPFNLCLLKGSRNYISEFDRYYFVTLKIGHPPKQYDLDIDSGSDLTWVQCDAPCTGCTKVNFYIRFKKIIQPSGSNNVLT